MMWMMDGYSKATCEYVKRVETMDIYLYIFIYINGSSKLILISTKNQQELKKNNNYIPHSQCAVFLSCSMDDEVGIFQRWCN